MKTRFVVRHKRQLATCLACKLSTMLITVSIAITTPNSAVYTTDTVKLEPKKNSWVACKNHSFSP